MPRFLVVRHEGVEDEVEKEVAALFEAGVDSKSADTISYRDLNGQEIKKRLRDGPALLRLLYHPTSSRLLSAYQIEADDELDAYHHMVMADREFSLNDFVSRWKCNVENYKGAEWAILKPIVDQIPAKFHEPLLKFSISGEKNDGGFMDRTWITPKLAREMWLIYNDPRPLILDPQTRTWGSAMGYHSAVPLKHLTYATLSPLATIPTIALPKFSAK